jgi:hypothetical protein
MAADDDRPCSCEESLRLRAELDQARAALTQREQSRALLEAERDHFKAIWQVECQRTLRALEHQATAERQARELRINDPGYGGPG